MPIDLIYDISVDETLSEYGKCIHAPESVFRVVAGLLLKISTEKPDESMIDDLGGKGLVVDFKTQRELYAFALQCFSAAICDHEGDGEMPVYHRPKPGNSCVLQEDQGGEWVDIFDFRACLNAYDRDKRMIDDIGQAPGKADLIYDDFKDRYTGTSESYDPDLTISGGSASVNRAALCRALKAIVQQQADTSAQSKQEFVDELGRYGLGFAVGSAIFGVLALIAAAPSAGTSIAAYASYVGGAGGLALMGTAGGIAGTAAGVWAQRVKDTEQSVFVDAGAIDDVACKWYKALKPLSDVSQEAFAAAVDMTGESPNAQALYNAISPILGQPLTYVTFLKLWKREISFGQAIELDDDCGCDQPLCFDFMEGRQGWLGDNYVEGLGFGIDTYRGRPDRLTCAADLGTLTFNRVEMYFSMDWPVYEGVALRNHDFSDITVNMQPGMIKVFEYDPPITQAMGAVDVRRAFASLPEGLYLQMLCIYPA